MRKFKLLLLTFLFVFIGIVNVKALDTSDKVYDYANVLSFEEEQELKIKIEEFIEEYNMDMAVVTVKYHDYGSTMEYADNFYDINGFGLGSTYDGLVCVIDFSTGHDDFWISTKGQAIIMFDDARINKILDSMDDVYYSNKTDYFNMLKAFVDDSYYYARNGIPASNRNVKLDKNGKPYIDRAFPWVGIAISSFIISGIVVLILVNRNKMVHKATNADLYLNNGSIKITNRKDQFLTTATTKVRISTSSSSGGGHVGGSSFHSSGGGFHGGGGRSH